MSIKSGLNCPRCGSLRIWRDEHEIVWENEEAIDKQRYRCCDCKKRFTNGLYSVIDKTNRIDYFGITLCSNKPKKITRESFSEPSNEVGYSQAKMNRNRINLGLMTVPNSVYLDESHYTQDYVRRQRDDCRKNYDLNMLYFKSLNKSDFDSYIEVFVRKNKMQRTLNINELKGVSGIYMLVLGEYKQAYIGQSKNIKKRIMQHWSKEKEFDRRIFGTPENSILPIDSFGAFDTTEIYCKIAKSYEVNEVEERLVSKFKKCYLLNRIAGGINAEKDEACRTLAILGSAKRRNMKTK